MATIMIILTILLVILFVACVLTLNIGGAIGTFIFLDLIVAIFIVGTILKKLVLKAKK